MKTLFYFFALLLCSLGANAQFGTISFNQDTFIVQRRVKFLTIHQGAQTDSLLTHKINGNIGRLKIGDLPFYPLSGNPSNFLTGITSGQVTTALGYTPVTNARTLTINGVTFDLTANRTWVVGDILSSGSYSNPSWITSLAYSKLTGTPTTLSGYGITDGVSTARTLTINGSAFDLSANRSWSVGTVTSVGLSSTDLSVSGSPVTSSGNITANLTTTGIIAGTYGILTVDSKGRATAGKRQEIYTGTTAGSGTYSVTYATPYSVEPNVIISQRGGTPTNTIVLSASSTTGFTVTANNRVEVLGLLPTYPTLNGAVVNVIVTEK